VLVLLSAVVFSLRQRRWLVTGWLWYLGTLVPVIGLIQTGDQSMADRYTYVPMIGLFIIMAWGVTDLTKSHRHRQIISVLSVAVLLVLAVCTWRQTSYWRTNFTLFEHALDVTRNNSVAHNYLAMAFAEHNEPDKAIDHYREALRISPNYMEAHNNIGMELALKGRHTEAIKHYKAALRIEPTAQTYNNLAVALLMTDSDPEDAAQQLRKALELDQNYSNARLNLAKVMVVQGKIDEAIQHYQEVLRRSPNNQRALRGLKEALEAKSKPGQLKKKKFKVVSPY
jgi:Tfp pilus assembly protein PilF